MIILKDRKVQTLKDLNIPWSKLFTPSNPPGTGQYPNSHHNAMSTLLMDDSPRKAELQPYNHLCVKEYSNVIRNRDLASVQEEIAQLKSPSPLLPSGEPESRPLPPPQPQLPIEIPHSLVSAAIQHHHPTPFDLPPVPLHPSPEFQFDQSVGIQPGATLLNPLPFTNSTGSYPGLPGGNSFGQGVIAPQMLFKNPSPQMAGYQNPQAFQQLSPSINPFVPPQHTHHTPLTDQSSPTTSTQVDPLPLVEATAEAKVSPVHPLSTSTPKKRKRKGKRETGCEASKVNPIDAIEYDETLLAIVGILDEVKFQSNIASWVKANGLWGPYHPQSQADTNVDVFTHGNFRESREEVGTLSDSGSVDSGRLGEGKKKRKDAVTPLLGSAVMDGPDAGDSLHTPANERQNQENASEMPLWFDSPPTVRHWVDRGRKALEALGIPIEHGLKH